MSEHFIRSFISNLNIGINKYTLKVKYAKGTYMMWSSGVDVVEWSRALDVRLSEWCCSVLMVWVQIPSREEQKCDGSKI